MATKVWQVEDIRNHLLAVQTGVRASKPPSLTLDDEERFAAYCQGCDATLKYLAERFGVNLDDTQPARKLQTSELRLKTWSQEDIKRNLKVAWTVMQGGPSFEGVNEELNTYYQGIKKTLLFLAISFGIEGFTLPSRNGSQL